MTVLTEGSGFRLVSSEIKGPVEDRGVRSCFDGTEGLFPGDAGAEPARASGGGGGGVGGNRWMDRHSASPFDADTLL